MAASLRLMRSAAGMKGVPGPVGDEFRYVRSALFRKIHGSRWPAAVFARAVVRLPHSHAARRCAPRRFEASRAPSTSVRSLAHMIEGLDALHERPLREAAIGSGHEIVAADELR